MKKKTITAVATLLIAAIITIGNYIDKDDTAIRPASTQGSLSTISGKSAFPDELIQTKSEGIVPFGYINATVTKVTDGDTIRIEYKGEEFKVRLLDIDTPESVKAGVEKQPYSEEASQMTKETLMGKNVKLVFEKDTSDPYDRLLAYILLENGIFYNAFMVENGYAICVFYSPNTLLKDYFEQLQDSAIENKKGFWQLPEEKRPFVENDVGEYEASYKS